MHVWPPPAWAVAPSKDELIMDEFEKRDNRRAPPKEKNENVFKKDDESTVASEQPNVDEHGNVVVTYRQALGKEKKKKDGDESDDDDGCDLGVLKCRGAFTSLDGLVSISRCRGWFLFRY